MKRSAILVLSALAVAGVGAAFAAAHPRDERVVPAEQAAAAVRALGIEVPELSCLAAPSRDGCPRVSEVVIVTPDEAADAAGYGPAARELSASRGPAATRPAGHNPNYVCGVIANDPGVYYTAQSTAQNHCFAGYGVTWMEMWGNIERWNATEGRWYTLDNCYKSSAGSGTLTCTSVYNCYHPNTQRKYRGSASAYTIIRGTGYFATDYSAAVWRYCY